MSSVIVHENEREGKGWVGSAAVQTDVDEELDKADRKMLSWFYRYLMHDELKGFDLLDLSEARAWGETLKERLSD